MDKDHFNHNEGDSIIDVKRKDNEEVLEISSTGYGLESVSKEEENEHIIQKGKN